jgi:hypothetical protein
MAELSDRTWDLPKRSWVMRMTWSELLFAHWPVDGNVLAPMLPKGLELDTREGTAWIGIVPFLMSDIALRFCPSLPGLSRFLELNVRTYVIHNGKPGVWFFSLDAANRIAVRVARATFNLPYMDALMSMRTKSTEQDTPTIGYQSQRVHRGEPPACFDASYRPQSKTFRALTGTLEHWLTARYCLYSADRKGNLYRGEIDHPPWTLSAATCQFRQNTMCQSLGIKLDGEPHLLFAQPVAVRAWTATRCLLADASGYESR